MNAIFYRDAVIRAASDPDGLVMGALVTMWMDYDKAKAILQHKGNESWKSLAVAVAKCELSTA